MSPSEHQELLASREALKFYNFLMNVALLAGVIYLIVNRFILRFIALPASWFPNAHCDFLTALLFAFAILCIIRKED
jgi:hypothetical protein